MPKKEYKLYVILSDAYDNNHIVGVFSKHEKAEASLKSLMINGYPGNLKIEEQELNPKIDKLYWWGCIINVADERIIDVYKRKVPLIGNLEHANNGNIVSYGSTREEALKNAEKAVRKVKK